MSRISRSVTNYHLTMFGSIFSSDCSGVEGGLQSAGQDPGAAELLLVTCLQHNKLCSTQLTPATQEAEGNQAFNKDHYLFTVHIFVILQTYQGIALVWIYVED